MLRYALYARKSNDDRKVTEKSIGEQVAECMHVAAELGLEIMWRAEESKSAMRPGQRPQFTELLRKIERGNIDAILCWHLNRLVRNMEEGGKLVQLVADGKIKEIRTPHGIYRTGESIWQVVIEAASATQYSLDQRNLVNRALMGNFKSGGCNYRALPGYRNERDPINPKKGIVVPDGEQFTFVRSAWEMFLQGTFNVTQIHKYLRDQTGFRYRQTLNLPSRPLSYSGVYFLLRNPFYAGFVKHKGELQQGRHVPMVTVDEFVRAQDLLNSRSFRAKPYREHAFTGLMTCGYCSQAITAETKRLKNGTLWEVYHCSDSYEKCTQRGMSKEQVDRFLTDHLRSLQFDQEVLQIVFRELREAVDARASRSILSAEHAAALVDEAKAKLERLDAMWLENLLTDEERYKILERKIRQEIEQATLAEEQHRSVLQRQHLNLRRAEIVFRRIKHEADAIHPKQKKALLKAVGDVTFYGREKNIFLSLAPILSGIVQFATRRIASLEPLIVGSESQHKTTPEEPFYVGGAKQNQLEHEGVEELLSMVIESLAGPLLPDLSDDPSGQLSRDR